MGAMTDRKLAPARRGPSMTAYKPTVRDNVARAALGVFGDTYANRKLARQFLGSSGIGGTGEASVADFTPAGVGLAADEAGRLAGQGHPWAAAGNLALAALPVPGKAAVKTAGRAVAGRAKGVIDKAVRDVVETAPTPGITAYHGSPHTFDQFSLDKIGTGEGAQAYGHGLYFAENEGVAKGYRDNLTAGLAKQAFTSGSTGQGYALRALQEYGSQSAAIAALEKHLAQAAKLGGSGSDQARAFEKWQPTIEEALGVLRDGNPSGSMYKVRINADPNDFLDWDAPLEQQSPRIQEGLNAAADKFRPGFKLSMDDRRGMSAYTDLGLLSREREMQPAATQALRESGIPGIKYLDQGSRGAGAGTRNFVVFDPKIIDIMKRYGVAAPVAAAMLANSVDRPMTEARAQ